MEMKNLAEKQLLEWKEELSKQRLKQSQARKVLEETNNTFHICPIERVDFNLYKNQHSISSPEVNRHSLKAYEELEIEYADFDFGTGY